MIGRAQHSTGIHQLYTFGSIIVKTRAKNGIYSLQHIYMTTYPR